MHCFQLRAELQRTLGVCVCRSWRHAARHHFRSSAQRRDLHPERHAAFHFGSNQGHAGDRRLRHVVYGSLELEHERQGTALRMLRGGTVCACLETDTLLAYL